MQKKQVVFKVVRITRSGKMKSAVYRNSPVYDLEYNIGRVTVPVVGKLLCFSTLKAAEVFKYCRCDCTYQKYVVLRGIGVNPKRIRTLSTDTQDIRLFWEDKLCKWEKTEAPLSSISVERFTPKKKVS